MGVTGCHEEKTVISTDIGIITVSKGIGGKQRHLLLETSTYDTDLKRLTTFMQTLTHILKADMQLEYTDAINRKPDKILEYDFIPLYILYSCGARGIHYYMVPYSYTFTISFGHEAGQTEYPIFFSVSTNHDLSEEEVKIIVYTIAYTIYAIGKGYAYNADPEKAIEIQQEHDKYVDSLDLSRIGITDTYELYIINDPIGHIFKVDMPLFNIHEYEYLLRSKNIQFKRF